VWRKRNHRVLKRICHSIVAVTIVIGTIAPSVYAEKESQQKPFKLPSDFIESLMNSAEGMGKSSQPQNVSQTVQLAQLSEKVHTELIVQFKEKVTPDLQKAAIHVVQGEVLAEHNGKVLIRIPSTSNWKDAIEKLKSDQSVQLAEPNVMLRAQAAAPNDPEFAAQWGLEAIEAGLAWDTLHEQTSGANPPVTPEPVVVAVIDTGVDANHPDLAGRLFTGFNTITGAVESDYSDVSGHGTHIAGTIAAVSNNDIGVSGTAGVFPVKILPIKALNENGEGSLFDVATAIERAIGWVGPNGEKVKVMNISFGVRDWLGDEEGSLEQVIINAQNQGIVVVAAAGNDGLPVQGGADGPPPYYPANLNDVISVGALGEDGEVWDGSNPGATLVAPGENIISTIPNGSYGLNTGTSFAAPFVSAAVALQMLANPQLTASQVRHSLIAGLSGNQWSMHKSIQEASPGSDPNPPQWEEGSTLTANVDVNRLTLQWPAAGGETSAIQYKLYQDGVALPGYYESPFEISGLNPETEYEFKVQAVDVWGNESSDGPTLTVRTEPVGTPFEKISKAVDGGNTNGDSIFGSSSEDGRFVVYSSKATNLVAGDTNGVFDIFLHDRQTNETKRISLSSDGSQSNGDSYAPIITLEGGYILFTSKAVNLTVEQDSNGNIEDLFLYETTTGKIEKVADDVSAIAVWTYFRSDRPYAMSANGRYIAFSSDSDNGDGTDTNGTWDVFLKDRWNGTTKRLTDRQNKHRDERASGVAMTPDGRYVAYTTEDSKEILNAYLYDERNSTTEEISVSSEGEELYEDSYSPSISVDGRYVAFSSYSNNLVPSDESWNLDVFVRDRHLGTTEIVSTRINGDPSSDYNESPWISANGRYVVFHSYDDLDPRADRSIQVYIHDRSTHQTKLLSKSPFNDPGTSDSWIPFITQNGRYVVFESYATNLTFPEHNDNYSNIYFKPINNMDAPVPVWEETAQLKVTQKGAHYVRLNWENGDDTGKYYKVSEGGQLLEIVQGNSYLVKNLEPGTTYQFSIQVGDESFNWSERLEIEAATLANRETTAPGTISAPIFTPEFGKLSVTWKEPTDPDYLGTKLLWRKLGTSTYRETPVIHQGMEKAEINGLINSTLYEVVFVTIDADGNETESPVYTERTRSGPQTARVSISNDMVEGNSRSAEPDVSDDGRYIVFSSHANNLVHNDGDNDFSDIFLYDRISENLQKITSTVDGFPPNNNSFRPKISGNGRFIVFHSYATNLTMTDDTDYHADVFLYDRDTDEDGKFDEVNATSIQEITANAVSGDSALADINFDGSVIVFDSSAKNLAPDDTWDKDVYVYQKSDETFSKIKLEDGIVPDRGSYTPRVSGDGNYIAFVTEASNLGVEDVNEAEDVYLYNVTTKKAKRISAFANEGVRQTEAYWPTISNDGRFVAYHYENYLTASGFLVYVHDRDEEDPTKANQLVSVTSDGMPAPHSTFPSISGDGRFVAFESSSDKIVPIDVQNGDGIFVYDRVTKTSRLVTHSYQSTAVDGDSEVPVLNYDGSVVVFTSSASNLVSNDFNNQQDIFVSTVTPASVPNWPVGSKITVTDKGENDVTLSWTPAEDSQGVSSYKIVYGDNQSKMVSGITRSAKIVGLEPGKTYTFTVQAANASELWTEDGPSLEVTTLEETNLANLTLEAQSNATVKLTWERPSVDQNIAGFEIYRRTGEAPAEWVGTVNDPSINYYIDKGEYLTTYTYYVMAIDTSGGKTRYSTEKNITTTGISMGSVRYTTPLSFNRYGKIGENLQIVAVGDHELTVKTVIEYERTDGTLLEANVDLTETEPGNYVGSLAIPAQTTKIHSIKAVASKGTMNVEVIGSQNLLFVGGNVTVQVSTEAGELPAGTYLNFSSRSKKIYTGVELTGTGSYTLYGLPASEDYDYQFTTPNGMKLEILDKKLISVKYGESSENDILVRIAASLKGKITYADESVQSKTFVTISQGDRFVYSNYLKINSNEEFSLPGLKTGDELKIEVRPEEAKLGYVVKNLTLQPGENVMDIEVVSRKKATLTGIVTDQAGEPVSKVTVHANQWMGSQQVNTETVTDENGRYTLELLEGTTFVYAMIPEVAYTKTITVLIEQDKNNQADFAFSKPLPGLLELDIFTKHIGGEWTKLDLDWRVLVHFRFNISHPSRNNNPGGLLSVYTEPGDVVKVCIDGVESKLPKTCGETTMNPSNRGKLELRLEQTDSQLKAKLDGSPSWQSYRGKLFSIGADGKRSYVSEKTYGNDMLLDIDQPGTYQLELSAYGYTAFREFEIAAGELKDLGTITLLGPGIYGGKSGNIVMTAPSEVLPGGLVQIRHQYFNTSSTETSDTKLILEIPAGTSLVENSIQVDGKTAVVSDVKSNEFTVGIGTVPSKGSGLVTYHLRLDEKYEQPNLSVMQKIHFTQNGTDVEERFGGASAVVTSVKLEAPSITGRKDLTVSGIAPVGSIVSVYDKDHFLGQTVASGTGNWKKTVRLTNADETSKHKLRAEAVRGEEKWITEMVPVTYEFDYPEIMQVNMNQMGERDVSFDPGQGVAVFPYVYVPGQSFSVSLNFQNDARVRDVKVGIGNGESSMGKGSNGTYTAIITPTKPGAIYVTYNVQKNLSFDDIPTQDEYENQIPDSLRNFNVSKNTVTQSETDPYQIDASTEGTVTISGKELGIGVDASFQSVDYSPTSNDNNWTASTGLAVHGFSFNYSISGDSLHYSVSAYIPESQFQNEGAANVLKTLINGSADRDNVETIVTKAAAGKYVKVAYKGFIKILKDNFNLWDVYELEDDIGDTVDNTDKLRQLEKLMDEAALNCEPEASREYIDRATSIANKYMAQEVVKWAMMIGAAAAGPATFGVGTLLLFGAGEFIEAVMDRAIELQIEDLKNDIAKDERCEKKEEEKKKVADPKWIYDPSGYVYEVEESNRIEGVTATAMYWDEEEQTWKQWDAEWYGQFNPQVTGSNGKYAWDVPEGKWKVIFTKEGFMTAESEELIVLPPHTDVNIRMNSLLPPGKMMVAAEPGGHSVDVVFDRHVLVDAVNDATISVFSAGQQGFVSITEVSAVGAVDFNGVQVAQQFKITFDGGLEVGKEYTVSASQGILSYNEVPIREDIIEKVVVPERDLPPAKVADVKTFTGLQEIALQWKDPIDLDLDHLIVSWKEEKQVSFENTLVVNKGEENLLLSALDSDTIYDIQIEAVDAGGSKSAKTEVKVSTVAGEVEIDLVAPRPVTDGLVKADGVQLKVTWNEEDAVSDGMTEVLVRWKESESKSEWQTAQVPKGTGSYWIIGLKPAQYYEVTVSALDAEGNESEGWLTTVKTIVGGTNPPVDPPPGGGGPGPEPGPEPEPSLNEAIVVVDEKGGTYKVHDNKFAMKLEPETVPQQSEILIVRDSVPINLLSNGYRQITSVYELSVKGENGGLKKPMLISLQYDAASLQGLDYRKLGIYRQDEKDPKNWTYVGGTVDPSSKRIFTEIDNLGNYAVILYQNSFLDIVNHWSRPEVEVLVSRHILSGVSKEKFAPNRFITRAEFTKLIVNFARESGITYREHANINFSDVPANAWYKDYLATAVKFGLVQGTNGRFMPNEPITREQMIAMIVRALNIAPGEVPDDNVLDKYKDSANVGKWAKTAMAYAIEHGIIKGMAGNQLKPKDSTTRAQAAVVFLRMMEQLGVITGEAEF
jgi:subtilisin family serine protease